MKVTAFSNSLQPQVSTTVANVKTAAGMALALATKYPYVSVEDGDWKLPFTKNTGYTPQRLEHILTYKPRLT